MAHNILIVDDDRINNALVKFGLKERGYNVLVAADGDEALEITKASNPDLIVLDVGMPKMNGYEFITELKTFQGFDITPIIMLTANETMEEVLKLEGIKGYFVKPVDLPELVKKIQECLGPLNQDDD